MLFTAVLVLMFCLSISIAYADTAKTGTITATTLNLRSGASTGSDIIVTLNQSAVLTILKSEGNWYQVKTSAGTIGWASTAYVTTKNTAASRGDIDRTKAKDLASEITSFAKQYLGVKYVWGGSSPSGFDCSGFVSYVFDKFNISLDRSSASMASNGIAVDKEDLRPGDIVFFDTNGGLNQINHVGIYIGDGEFIQSSSANSAKKVVISTLFSGFYKESYMRARRVF
jgi:cell wall-associated NlpC family hydrolase